MRHVTGMKYKAVIFDLFGTLVDNFVYSEYHTVMNEVASILAIPEEAEFFRLWRECFHERSVGIHGDQRDSFHSICNTLNITVTDEQMEKAFSTRLTYTAQCLAPRADTIATIKTLRSKGYKIGLISDCTGEVPILWPQSAFNGLFDTTIFSCIAGIKKPDPRIYRMATDALGVLPEDCLYIGDGSSTELTGAKAAGLNPVLIRDPNEHVDAHYIDREENWEGPNISCLREVLDLVD